MRNWHAKQPQCRNNSTPNPRFYGSKKFITDENVSVKLRDSAILWLKGWSKNA